MCVGRRGIKLFENIKWLRLNTWQNSSFRTKYCALAKKEQRVGCVRSSRRSDVNLRAPVVKLPQMPTEGHTLRFDILASPRLIANYSLTNCIHAIPQLVTLLTKLYPHAVLNQRKGKTEGIRSSRATVIEGLGSFVEEQNSF